jgi:iron complex transport system ATP-binding protein
VKDFLMMARFWSVGYFKTASKIDMQKIDEAIDFMAIGDIANRNILELSGGQFQRVLIAQNIVQDSSILIFDEPISHLDIDAQGFIMERLKYLNMHFNKTIILTAHEINMPLEFCQNIILIDEGKIVAEEDGNSNKLISSIEKIYKTKFHIGRNPHSNRPYVIAVNSSK